jgi:ribosomal protein S3AE
LIDNGADVNKTDGYGFRPIDLACSRYKIRKKDKSKSRQTVEILKQANARMGPKMGLHLNATVEYDTKFIRYLIENRAHVNRLLLKLIFTTLDCAYHQTN